MRYLLRRIGYAFFLLISVSVLSFSLIEAAPGDFFDNLRMNPRVSERTIEVLRAKYGFRESLPMRYVRWVSSVASGDWGFSLAYNSPASGILWPRALNTLLLTGTSTVCAWLLSIAIGIAGAIRPGRLSKTVFNVSISGLLAFPELTLALLLLLFAARTGSFPTGGMTSPAPQMGVWNMWKDVSHHLFLPVGCLALGALPLLSSHVRTAVSEALRSPFVAAARAHGIPLHRLLFRYALPAAANPLISLLGFSIGMLLSSSLLIEAIFAWPGIGQLLLEAILQRDFYLVVDAAMLAGIFFVAGNLLADILLYFCDPRIRIS